ncbi:helix-turn-helix transcriptional regulator [Chryseobacterium camelliae]|uniref:Helix-turn-helix transcriptional regulator n=1 Tax=Chryseobacterium camelliae TaxID=1265445 RepID=A0ABY7QNH7_9FLAO|nr:helix-turn-helix transcriptional regulator [Chryseobacterium camelliae]WBV60266.1 helix-turn-helix transcriptional regulator [Chryseobacterium camelliae]
MEILRVKEILNEKGWRNKDLADKIGTSENSVSAIVTGKKFPKPETLVKIADVLDIDIRELFNPSKSVDLQEIFTKDENGNLKSVGFIKK